jgi:hypothetical protein
MKTYINVIDETVAAYHKAGSRSKLSSGKCMYNGPDGRQCALARCCTPESKFEEGFSLFTEYADGRKVRVQKEFTLKPEYSHLTDLEFWYDIQRLHDIGDYWRDWIEDGLSDKGKKRVEELKEKWLTKNESVVV